MKKSCLILLTLSIVCLSAFSAQKEDKFISALRTCSPSYKDSGNVNVNGVSAFSKKSMSGWQNKKCTYTETLTINSRDITTKCSFTKEQVNEIVSVADAYYTTLKYNKEEPDTSSLDAVKNNPVFNVMNKYLQDPSVCTMSGLE